MPKRRGLVTDAAASRMQPIPLLLGLAFATALLGLGSGCTLAQYQTRKPKAITPAQTLDLRAAEPPLAATVQSVIVHEGPGAWKQHTWWDEYVVAVRNEGDQPAELGQAELIDCDGKPSEPGTDPWKLERLSQQWWQTNATRNVGFVLGFGAGTVAATGLVATGGLMVTGSLEGGLAAGAAVLVVAPVVAVGTVVRNVSQKHRVEAEFNRRRLALPVALAPGQTVAGSLFFRLAPGPQRLVLHYRIASQPRTLTVDLAPLAALHFKERTYRLENQPPAKP